MKRQALFPILVIKTLYSLGEVSISVADIMIYNFSGCATFEIAIIVFQHGSLILRNSVRNVIHINRIRDPMRGNQQNIFDTYEINR